MRGISGPGALNTGAIASAVVASICCVGPLALALMGLGGGALLLRLAPYRPYALAAAGLFLGAAFFLSYRNPQPEECESGAACSMPSTRRRQRIWLWIVTAVVALAAAFPYYSRWLF